MIILKKEHAAKITAHALEEAPAEACGILAGGNGKTEKVYLMVNADSSPETFFMDPREQLKVMKEIRNSGMELAAIYHSHPESEAYPSPHDVELAFYPDASYIIISLKNKKNPCIRSFRIVEGKITEQEVRVE